MDAPYDRLEALPRTLWLSALITSAGERGQRLEHTAAWLASLHLICDMAGWKWWGFPFLVIGSNSIVAYVISWTLVEPIHQALERHFSFIINAIARVLENLLSQFASLNDQAIVREFTLGAMTMCVVWLMLWWLYNKKIFVKI
jgi:predicted acyltransferase